MTDQTKHAATSSNCANEVRWTAGHNKTPLAQDAFGSGVWVVKHTQKVDQSSFFSVSCW